MGEQLINLADIDVNEKLKDTDRNEKYQNRGVYNVMNYLNNYLIIIYDFYKINLKNSKELSDQCHLLSLANGLSMYGMKNRCYKDTISSFSKTSRRNHMGVLFRVIPYAYSVLKMQP